MKQSTKGSVVLMRIQMVAAGAAVMVAVAGCGGGGAQTAALQAVWDSYDTVQRKAFCEAAIQNGQNFYGPARAMAAKAGNGVTQYNAQQFLLEPTTCPDAWLMGGY